MSVNIFKNGILSKIAGAVGDAVPLINNFLTNQAGKGAADANTVYVLNNKIDELNSSLTAFMEYMGFDPNMIPLIPTMTSNTTPYGEVSASDYYSDYQPYLALGGNTDLDNNISWITNSNNNSNQWIQYKFTSPVCAKKCKIRTNCDQLQGIPKTIKIQASNDSSTWFDIYSGVNNANVVKTDVVFDFLSNEQSFTYWRFYIIDSYSATYNRTGLAMLQLYK